MRCLSRLLRGFSPAAVILCALTVAGCGDPGPPRAVVLGKVTLDGAPVEKGAIAFIPTGGTTGPSSGAMIENGTYRTLDGMGPILGTHRVEITAYRAVKSVDVPAAGGAGSGPSAATTAATMEMYIPEKYNKNSELTLDVKAGDNPKDFELTSK